MILLSIIVAIWLWGNFLDRNEHDPDRVRAVMVLILATATCWEVGLHASGLTYPFTLWVSVVGGLWGGLDALLRYPASHELESFFCLKQCGLLFVKSLTYALGMVNFRTNAVAFLVVLLYSW